MKSCQQGVWISVRSSTVLSLYDATIYLRLLEVDYTSILPAPAVARDTEVQVITGLYTNALRT